MPDLVSPEAFGEWLVEDQLSYLDENLSADTLELLWDLCAGGVDSGPVVHLVGLAAARGLPLGGRRLLELRPSTLAAVLAIEKLEGPVEEAWQQAELSHLVSFCLLDRYLRRQAAERWDLLGQSVLAAARDLLASGGAPSQGLLLRLQGSQQRALRAAFPAAWDSWAPAWEKAARDAIKILAERPRDVSQANAERLLSQQVYTDPGHFLLELLQNADDARAASFSVEFGPDALTVRHDGDPFDFRDLVGVLSIGQTTKRSTQIGYFGVGFKSVYEVSDRPRLYSGHFAFEIADISVPRALAARPQGEETVLVLPLKRGLDPASYWARAVRIEAALLLNVPHLRRVRWIGSDGEVEICLSPAEGDVMVLREGEGESRYLRWSGVYRHEGPRPPGKPAAAGVHLAVPVDGHSPVTTLYSFLPVRENSGLSFIVGSHFDVPVDRERLDETSDWNQGVIGSIPALLAQKLAQDPRRAWELLPSMPLPEDPLGPLFTGLPLRLAEALAEVPLLPGGRLARQALLLAPEIVPLFDLEALTEPPLLAPESERTRRWLELLGAASYSLSSLLEDLARGVLPGRLASRHPADWSRLHALLMGSIHEVAELPVFLDADRVPVSARQAVLLEPAWAELFLVPPRSLDFELACLPDSAALLAKLGVARYGWPDLLGYLRDSGPANVCLEKLFERLLEAPRGVTLACLELPLFLDRQGRPGPLVPSAARHLGVVAAVPGLPVDLLPEMRILTPSDSLDRLLDSLRWPRFNLADLVGALEWHALSTEQCDLLLSHIEASDLAWTGPALETLASLTVFESAGGPRLPLSQLWRYDDDELADLLPTYPALAPGSVSERVVEKLGLGHRLSRANLDLLLALLPGSQPEKALRFLSARAPSLSRAQIERLLRLPLFGGSALAWPDSPQAAEGALVARPEYISLFLGLGQQVLDREATESVMPLLHACAYPLLGLPALVDLLQTKAPPVALLDRLHEVLLAEAVGLQLAFSAEVRQRLPVWLSHSGRVVASVDVPPSAALAELTDRRAYERLETPHRAELQEIFPLLEDDAYLRRRLFREVRMGKPLLDQPAWCDSLEKVDRLAQHLPLSYLMVSARGVLHDRALQEAPPLAYPWLLRSPLADELIHPDSSAAQKRDCEPLDPALVLETFYPLRHEPAMRQAFYAYLQAELGRVAGSPEARAFLLDVALWRSEGGHWKSLDELILDPELPDLGGDWRPHPEIPPSLLGALETVLGVGRPEPEAMLRDYLLPAYLSRPAARASLLQAMARTAQGMETGALRRALRGPRGDDPFPLPDGGDLRDAYAPPDELAALPLLAPTRGEHLPLLRRLGLAYLPGARQLCGASRLSRADGEALLGLVEWAWKGQPEQLEPLWETLRSLAWMPAGDGGLKLPRQLFLPSAELEELVGSAPEIFLARRLPVALARRLGMKEESDLDAVMVLAHLRRQVRQGQRVTGRLYAYLEESLRSDRLSPRYLLEQLKDVPWVWTDEGEYRLPAHVLALPAFRYFGPHRGTWEGAYQRYPRLSELFGIATSVTPEVVLDFLREVHEAPQIAPSHRLLRCCLSFLGEQPEAELPRHWKALPATLASTGQPLLAAADSKGLVRSNSPTLTALFAGAGRLLVADPGEPEQGPSLDMLYGRLGIPRLRDAYTVRPDRSGREVGPEMAEAVVAFRGLLRGLAAVLPRLRAARPQWEAQGEWLADSRLAHFTSSGPIRVLQDLRLEYELPQVATVAVEAAAAFDPLQNELLASAAAVAQPAAHAVALADGLLDLIYQGPGSEGLVDLLNLLIPLARREAMEAYLDRRHFPRALSRAEGSLGRERLGEIMDYGLHKLLERRFPQLAGADWSAWRRPDLVLVDDPASDARELCRAVGQPDPDAALVETLTSLLSAPDLEDALRELWEGSEQAPRGSEALSSAPSSSSLAASSGQSAEQTCQSPPVAMVARDAAAAGGLAQVGQKVLGRLGRWLGVGPVQKVQVLGHRTTIPDVAESYRHPPERHLLVSSKALHGHDLYCLASLGVDFDPRHQVYLPAELPWPEAFLSSGRTLEFSGRLTDPDRPLPLPLYSRLRQPPVVRGARAVLRGPDGMRAYRLALENPDAELSYTVELGSAPELDGWTAVADPDARLLKPTAPLMALPPLVLEWISWARSSGLGHWQLAQQARDFVITHYLYDLAFLETPERQELATRPYRGDENRTLTLLHAGAGGRYLGRGVCLELSALLLEMLRRARIPAVLAGVWMLDMGLIHHPDHVIVLVQLPSGHGPVWMPLEVSVDRSARPPQGMEAQLSRQDLLQAATDLVLGPGFASPSEARARERAQEEALLVALGGSRRLEALLECFARSGRYLREVDDELRWLAAKGYLSVDKEELYRVSPRARKAGDR